MKVTKMIYQRIDRNKNDEKHIENKGAARLLRNPAAPLFSDFFHSNYEVGNGVQCQIP